MKTYLLPLRFSKNLKKILKNIGFTLSISMFRNIKRFCFAHHDPFVSDCHIKFSRLSQSLRSAFITKVSSLLRTDPPLLLHRYSYSYVSYAWDSPLSSRDRFLCSIQKPVISSCHLYAGCRLISNQVPFKLISNHHERFDFDIILSLSTPHRWIIFIHLLITYLTWSLPCLFP